MPKKFILNFTPTGMIPTKAMTPHVPEQPEEIIEQVLDVLTLGVNMVHLHARDGKTGAPTYRKEVYERIIAPIRRAAPELVICASLSGRHFPEFEKRSEVLELTGDAKPDFGSLTLGSLNFTRQASMNSPQMIQDLAKAMLDRGIAPELEVFDHGMLNYARYLAGKGHVRPPFYVNLILGNIATAQATLLDLGLMIRDLPDGAHWSGGGLGNAQLWANAAALVDGGGVRIGLEDNIWYDDGRTELATNRRLVERVLRIAEALGREPYTQAETRRLLLGR